ncbi:MAG: hypothetical protein ACI9W4_000510 [Rhodothermales bacterium]|jgi:uncharacterized protein (TIGR02757 family)
MDQLARRFESLDFIAVDPISVPLGFDDPRDQEVIGLYAALLAWGRRETILKNMAALCERMAYRPFRFVSGFRPETDSAALEGFGHRTFRPDDAVNLTLALKVLLDRFGSLEAVFSAGLQSTESAETHDVGPAIEFFSESVMGAVPDTPARLQKHIARPSSGSACKRLCMYLRWMVRSGPVDLGIWSSIPASALVVPLDVHSGRQARALGLLERSQNDWRAAQELTAACRRLDPSDPARYDFALFGSGAFDEPLDNRFTKLD